MTSIKTFKGRQGIGFDATLLRNGIEIGTVSDNANGGALSLYINDAQERTDLYNYAQTKVNTNFEVSEYFLDELVNYELFIKKMATKIKKSFVVAIIEPQYDEHGVPSNISTYNCSYTPENIEKIKQKTPHIYFLNEDFGLLEIKKVKKTLNKK